MAQEAMRLQGAVVALALAVLVLALPQHASAASCTLTAKGVTYDFSTLTVSALGKEDDWEALDTREKGKYRYFLNVCAPLTSSPCGTPPNPDNAACVITAAGTEANYPKFFGDASSASLSWINSADPSYGAKLTYKGATSSTLIRFFCGKGMGEPVFIEATASTYVFEWRTEVACGNDVPPSNEKGCTVRNAATGDQYDLSPLIGTKMNWRAVDIREKEAYEYEMNVCRPLVQVGNFTGDCAQAGTAVCQRKRQGADRVNPMSLGWAAQPVFRNGLISISTRLGTTCGSYNVPRGSQIDFTCDPNIGLGHPIFNREERCVYYFNWPSSAACPIREQVGDHCVVTDSVTGVTYDLSALHKDRGGYTTTSGSFTYTVNICGGIVGGPCKGAPGACQNDAKSQYNMGIADTQVTFDDGDLTLTYTGGDLCGNTQKHRETTITFICRPGEPGQLVFLDEDVDCSYNFAFYTEAACADEEPVECTVVDPETNLRYDLSPLTRTGAQPNWDAITKNSTTVRHVLLNVCAPLTRTGLASNCSATSASCSVTDNLKSIVPLGNAAGPVFKQGQLMLEYKRPNQPCGNTRVIFNCKPEGGLGKPMYVGVVDDNGMDDCTTIIAWETSMACPIDEAVGANCAVTDPISGTNFDLSNLKRDADYVITEGDTEYRINLCGTLSSTAEHCSATADPYMAACAYKPGDSTAREINFGKRNAAPVFDDGRVSIEFSGGDDCDEVDEDGNKLQYSTQILFQCDLSTDGRQGPEFDTMMGLCTARFIWRTSSVCAEDTIECVVENPKTGDVYDLTTLMKYDGNWQANDIKNSHSYILNVCKAVLEDPNNKCPHDVAGCQVTKEGSYSIGVPEAPQIDPVTGNLYLEYFGGSLCRGAWNRTSRIDFVCDKTAGLGQPRFVGEDSFCTYKFQWVSSAACPVTDTDGVDCTVVDPITNDVYNFTSLINPEGYNLSTQVGNDTYVYSLGVCGALRDKCGLASNVGACQYKVGDASFGFSLGNPQASPQIVNGEIRMTLQNGAPCRGNRFQRSTTIIFECDEDAGKGSPVFVSEGADCSYYFRWRTALACRNVPEAIECRATNYKTREVYDLSPLLRNRRNWVARNDASQGSSEYQINVCRPLVSGSHTCSSNMAACKVDGVPYTPDYDMGKARGPFVASDGTLTLSYPSGAPCETSPGSKSGTYIEFSCPREANGQPIPGIIGAPVFLYQTKGCVAHFTWKTSYACPLAEVDGDSCKVTDLLSGDTFDFSGLSLNTDNAYHVVGQDSRRFDYHINVCKGAGKPCANGAAVCQTRQTDPKFNYNLGMPSSSPVFNDGLITLTMVNGSGPCGVTKSARSTVINFVCDRNATTAAPAKIKFLEEQEDCSYHFEWATSAACHSSRERECTVRDPATNAFYDLSSLMNSAENWLAEDSREDNKYAYAINVCRNLVPMPQYPDCLPNSAACQISKTDDTFLERPMGDYDGPQFKDGQLFIQYSNGAKCSNGMARSTRINFFCGDSVGEPIYIQETSDCQYQFSWTTSAACSTNGVGPTLPPMSAGNCLVTDPVTGLDYDLKPLKGFIKAPRNNDPLDDTNESFKIAACGDVPCGNGNAGACATLPNNSTVNLGKSNDFPRIISNSIQLSYTGGDICPKTGKPRTTLIIFTCDRRYAPDTSQPEFQDVTDDCVYIFRWPVNTVCDPVRVSTPCVVRDFARGETYDLSPLTRTAAKGNWLAVNADNSRNAYYINVCHTLVDIPTDPQHICRGAAVCQTSPANPSLPVKPLGLLGSSPRFVNGNIRLEYSMPFVNDSTQLCGDGKRAPKSIITFSCKPGTLGRPVLVDVTPDCEYLFTWETSAACSTKRVVGDKCKVSDPISGLKFDLSDLSGQTAQVSKGDYLYYVTACGDVPAELPTPAACAGSGACQTKPSSPTFVYQMGKSTSALTYADGQLTLEYLGGPICHKGTSREANRTTVIVFECDHDATGTDGNVIFESESDDCTYYFTWKTKAACRYKDEVECTLYDKATGKLYDLTPLQKSTGNWVAVSGDHQGRFNYSINVCHSLNPEVPPTGCNLEAGICQDGAGAINLGGVNEPTIEDGALVMRYDNGDADLCPDRGTRTAKITFTCGQSKFGAAYPLGRPEFSGEFTTCDYDFTWVTPAACPVEATLGSDCKLTDPDTNQVYDLNPLGKKAWSVTAAGHSYTISACAPLNPPCPGNANAGACQQASNSNYYSLGLYNKNLIYQGGAMHMRYSGGTLCHGTYQRQTIISFVCDPCAKPGNEGPRFLVEEEDCTYAFVWRTSLVCSADRTCGSVSTTSRPGPTDPSNAGKKHKSNAGTIIGVVIVVLIMLVGIGIVGYNKGYIKFKKGIKYSRVSHHTGVNEDISSDEENI